VTPQTAKGRNIAVGPRAYERPKLWHYKFFTEKNFTLRAIFVRTCAAMKSPHSGGKGESQREGPQIPNDFPAGGTEIFTPRCCTQSAMMPLQVVCLSVCPPVTFRYREHVGWNTSKIISRPNSLRHLLTLTPTWAI